MFENGNEINPGRSSHRILCSSKRKIKKNEDMFYVVDLEIAPRRKTRIFSFACICVKKLEDIKSE